MTRIQNDLPDERSGWRIEVGPSNGPFCKILARDSSRESGVVVGLHEQALELASLQ